MSIRRDTQALPEAGKPTVIGGGLMADMARWGVVFAPADEGQGGEGGEGEAEEQKPAPKKKPAPAQNTNENADGERAAAELAALRKEIADLKKRQSEYGGLTPQEVAEMKAAKQEADRLKAEAEAAKKRQEEEELARKGDFEALRKRMAEEHEKAVKDKESRLAELQGVVDTLNSRINGMTVSTNFAASRFIAEETLLSAAKAQKLFGDHFEIEDGRMVPYDAPRGAAKRSPLVDARGEPLAFDEAIKRIVESDADRDIILKAKSKPGTGQAPTGGKAPQPQPSEPRGVARIALGIAALRNGSGR